MPLLEVGRLCIKTAGREAGLKCVIVEVTDKNFVLIDGQVKRRRCNIQHLEPLEKKLKIKKGASSDTIKKEFKKLGIEIKERVKKEKKAEKPVKKRKTKEKVEEKEKPKKEKKPKKVKKPKEKK